MTDARICKNCGLETVIGDECTTCGAENISPKTKLLNDLVQNRPSPRFGLMFFGLETLAFHKCWRGDISEMWNLMKRYKVSEVTTITIIDASDEERISICREYVTKIVRMM